MDAVTLAARPQRPPGERQRWLALAHTSRRSAFGGRSASPHRYLPGTRRARLSRPTIHSYRLGAGEIALDGGRHSPNHVFVSEPGDRWHRDDVARDRGAELV